MSKIVEVTESGWRSEVIDAGPPVVINFWGPACPWCKRLDPIYEEMAEEFGDRLKFTKVNVAESPGLASGLGIMGTPTLKFFCDGRSIYEVVGFRPRERLRQDIEKALEEARECIEKSSKV
ncbi:MAG: thioredoxin family protein [Thermoplasmata archaeon]